MSDGLLGSASFRNDSFKSSEEGTHGPRPSPHLCCFDLPQASRNLLIRSASGVSTFYACISSPKNDLEEGKEGCKGAVAFFSLQTTSCRKGWMDRILQTLAGEFHNESLDVELARRGCVHRPCNHKAGYKTKNPGTEEALEPCSHCSNCSTPFSWVPLRVDNHLVFS